MQSPPQSASPPTKDQWALLAGIRFFLAFIVLYGHYCSITQSYLPGFGLLLQCGTDAAVGGFFLISGYSIAASVERDRQQFYVRRFWRIAPVYGLCFALAVYAYHSVAHLGVFHQQIWGNPNLATWLNAFALNGIVSHPLPSFVVSWTLACEVFFYAIAPWLSCRSKRAVAVLCAVSIAAYIARIEFLPQFIAQYELCGMAYVVMFWWWGLGWAMYRYRDDVRLPWLILLPVFLIQAFGYGGGYWSTETIAAVGLALVYGPRIRLGDRARWWLNFGGGVSYPLYLVHYPLMALLADRYDDRLGQSPASYLVASVAAGVALYVLVDAPVQKLVRHFQGRRAASAIPVATVR